MEELPGKLVGSEGLDPITALEASERSYFWFTERPALPVGDLAGTCVVAVLMSVPEIELLIEALDGVVPEDATMRQIREHLLPHLRIHIQGARPVIAAEQRERGM